ncbi:MAG: serine protease, partial [Elusimicrobia bacterium]|nr:serine protease [Elusimicrobiota bacterium]
MRALRVVLALILTAGPVQAQPVVDLLTRYAVPADEIAASADEGDAPQGSGKRLAALESDLALVSESLEGFAHPQDAEKALLAAKPRIPAGTAPFFRDRATALGALYRTLAVVDYTWALRFPEPPCAPAAKRSALLRSDDGLFIDSFSGKTSAWMTVLLGPSAKGKDLESALDQASASVPPSQAEYARLRARQSLITKALASEDAVGEARAELYCKRAETRVKLAAANRASGPQLAARSSGEMFSRRGLVILAGKTTEGLEARGAGVVLETKAGTRVLTDRHLGAGEVVALLDGRSVPVPLSVDREDVRSGLLLLRPEGDLGEALILAEAAPKKDDLVFALAHSDRLGAWTKTQGLVTSSAPDQFQTDAVADASMTGGAVLDEEGRVAGLLVLRRIEGARIDWPTAVAAPALRAWLDGGQAPVASPVALTDEGTTKILTASRPLLQSMAVGDGATTAGYGFDTQTQWGSVHATCMANCGDSGPSSSYSGNADAELGQALGKLMAIGAEKLIFKGIPALFRGIGALFKSKPHNGEAQAVTTYAAPSQIKKVKVEPPKVETPKPECTFEPVKLPKSIGAEPIEFRVRFSCKELAGDPKIELGGHKVVVSVGWKGLKASTYSITTDANGYASLPIQVQSVEASSQRAHDELDNYNPDKKRAPSDPPLENSPGVGSTATS